MRSIFLLAASSAALAACSPAAEDTATADEPEIQEVQDPMAPEPASWSYEGDTGPANWGSLGEEYATCDTGTVQSPIDLVRADATEGSDVALEINWASGPLTIEGVGFNSNIVAPDGGYIMLEGERYDFVQAHLHMPSEYALDGERPAGDIHFVHANDEGELAVIGVFLEEGEASESLGAALAAFNDEEGERTIEDATFDPESVLPANRSFFRFPGSLTTPPCSEGVNWVFMAEPVTVSAEQIEAYKTLYGETARPLQPVGEREILFIEG